MLSDINFDQNEILEKLKQECDVNIEIHPGKCKRFITCLYLQFVRDSNINNTINILILCNSYDKGVWCDFLHKFNLLNTNSFNIFINSKIDENITYDVLIYDEFHKFTYIKKINSHKTINFIIPRFGINNEDLDINNEKISCSRVYTSMSIYCNSLFCQMGKQNISSNDIE